MLLHASPRNLTVTLLFYQFLLSGAQGSHEIQYGFGYTFNVRCLLALDSPITLTCIQQVLQVLHEPSLRWEGFSKPCPLCSHFAGKPFKIRDTTIPLKSLNLHFGEPCWNTPKSLNHKSETNLNWVVVSNIFFYFHPYLEKIPILTNVFQMGWNHQPEHDPKPLWTSSEKSVFPSRRGFAPLGNRRVEGLEG